MTRPEMTDRKPPQLAHWFARRARMPEPLALAFWHQAVEDANQTESPGSAAAHAVAVENMQRSCCAFMEARARTTLALGSRLAGAYARRVLRNDYALFAHVALVAALGVLIAS